MLENLFHPHVSGRSASERLMIELYKRTGMKQKAYDILRECSQQSRRNGAPFMEVLRAHAEINRHFSESELETLLDLTSYTGSAAWQTENAVKHIRSKRREK